ncbi:DUF695 domain-containing protein [Chryseobacterium sp. PBS4-4]|uniref:DUF695 domain-containing protein n=1 Tax=Chryseobacterium edaphi TaxID=2976532 RepID=A0ABT2W7S6_9FLAO|nr:DUF695 domain-containing protein [Chryseobacterium edaphi]MCU7618261.1 DUF695 domain-containing protein [Chryseobacterium edaphi]
MGIFDRVFGKKEDNSNLEILTYQDFWDWFLTKEKEFEAVVKNRINIEKDFFEIISPNLHQINEGFYFLAGISDDDKVDFIVTAEGEIKNIVFVEELIDAAPTLENWKFTALKPEMNLDSGIRMEDHEFTTGNIFFYANEIENYPDEIDITFVYENLNNENKDSVVNGVCIFLDNFLGELNFATQIDTFNVIGKDEATQELIPVSKLKDYLQWREREFTEKYKNIKNFDEEEKFSIFEASLHNGLPLIAAINTSLLEYDSKASYSWISVLKTHYNGENNNGLPEKNDYERLSDIEEKLIEELKNENGHLYIGRESADNVKETYFASKDFREPSKIFRKIMKDYPEYKMSLEIYKDKYWQSFERYNINQNI